MKVDIQKGDSFTIAFQINTNLNIENVVVQVGEYAYSGNDLPVEDDLYILRLKSSTTARMRGQKSVIVAIDTTEMGIRKTLNNDFLINVIDNYSNFADDSVSEIINATYVIDINEEATTTNIELANIYRPQPQWSDIQDKPSTFTPTSHTHTKNDVGLGNVDNTSDTNKPISTATQTALNTKLTIETASTFATITNSTVKRLIHVVADETNEGISTLYFHDSIGLNYIPTSKLY